MCICFNIAPIFLFFAPCFSACGSSVALYQWLEADRQGRDPDIAATGKTPTTVPLLQNKESYTSLSACTPAFRQSAASSHPVSYTWSVICALLQYRFTLPGSRETLSSSGACTRVGAGAPTTDGVHANAFSIAAAVMTSALKRMEM